MSSRPGSPAYIANRARERVRRSRPEVKAAESAKAKAAYRRRDPLENSRNAERRFSKFYLTHPGRATHMLNSLRNRCRRSGVAYTIDRAWIVERLERGICEVTGLPFVFKVGHGRGHRVNPWSPSLERKDPTGPYTPENVVVACWIYNRAKGAFTADELLTMARAIVERAPA